MQRMRNYYSQRSIYQRPAQEQPYIPLFDQPAVREKMLKFHSDCLCPRCSTCLEQFPGVKLHCDATECQRCNRDKHVPQDMYA